MKMRHSRWASLLLLALPTLSCAHSPVPGLGRFYSGMLHPVLAPAALIALVALGLLIGQRGLANARLPVLAFLLMVAVGGVVGSQLSSQIGSLSAGPNVDTGLLGLGLLVAACVLTAWQPPPTALMSLAGSVGALAGLGLSDMAVGAGRWVVLSGTWLGAAFLALGVAAVAELARQAWQQIGLRVVASWLAASALLVLGLQWVGPLPKDRPAKASSVTVPAPDTN